MYSNKFFNISLIFILLILLNMTTPKVISGGNSDEELNLYKNLEADISLSLIHI